MPEIVDLREFLEAPLILEQFRKLTKGQSDLLFTLARRPYRGWHREVSWAHPLVLSSAPHLELVCWLPGAPKPDSTSLFHQQHDLLLDLYRQMFVTHRKEDLIHYRSVLQTHISEQEEQLFPWLLNRVPIERAVRELRYEHQGLEKTSANLETLVQESRAGTLSQKSKEQFDLDYYHLLEHHLEREKEALIPLIEFLKRG